MMLAAAVVIACQFLFAVADTRVLAPVSLQREPCILVRIMERNLRGGDGPSQDRWQCELSSTDAAQTGYMFVDVEGLSDEDLKGVRSGVSSLLVDGASLSNGKLKVPTGAVKAFNQIPMRGPAAEKIRMLAREGQRKLAAFIPDERVALAVQVVSPDSNTTNTLGQIRDGVFGTAGDPLTLKERFQSCSYGEVLMKPYNGTTAKGRVVLLGGFQVGISIPAKGVNASIIENAVLNRLTALLGDLPSQFDHVLICLPAGVIIDGAYATLGGWKSVYGDPLCTNVAYTFHEVGHNLGLDHSTEGGDEYGDLTCTMGFGIERTCYNPAKSAQLYWYSERKINLNFARRGGFNGTLIGVNNYRHAQSAGKYVYAKVEGYPFDQPDVFVGFNLARGIHMNTGEARNLVTVHLQSGKSKSILLAKLPAGRSYTIPDFDASYGTALIIRVNSIVLPAAPALPVANVEVFLAGCPPGTCGPDCNACCVAADCVAADPCAKPSCEQGACIYDTSRCDGVFRMELTTDDNPTEVSWDVIDRCTGKEVAAGESYTSESGPISLVSKATIGKSSFIFTMRDSFGDGMSYGTAGNFRVTLDGVPTFNVRGESYTNEFSADFGGQCV